MAAAGGVLVWGVYPVVSTMELVGLVAALVLYCAVLAPSALGGRPTSILRRYASSAARHNADDMRQPEIPPALTEILRAVASERRLALAHDTHYDAFDWELSWWAGRQLHRLNFQPWLDDKVLISYNVDSYPVLPRLLRWARRWIPFFPHLARTTSQSCGEFGPHTPKEFYAARVRELLDHAA